MVYHMGSIARSQMKRDFVLHVREALWGLSRKLLRTGWHGEPPRSGSNDCFGLDPG